MPRRISQSGTFFVTTIANNRSPLFQSAANAELMVETLQHYRREGLYKLHAYVVMPDHIHIIITTENLSRAMQHIKGGFSRLISLESPVWQPGSIDSRIRDASELTSRRNYIHQNPVRARLVANEADYPYSSAHKSPQTPR